MKPLLILGIIILALIVLLLIGYFVYRHIKSKLTNENHQSLPNKNSAQENHSDEKDIVLIFGQGDQKENSGKSNHKNIKATISDIKANVKEFYDKFVEIKEEKINKNNKDIVGYHAQIIESKKLLLINEFQKTTFETQHNFIQYFFPNKSISKSGDSRAPYVKNPSIIKTLIQNNQITIDDIKNRFENFSNALTFYLEATGIHYAMPEDTDNNHPEKAQKQQVITDNIQQAIKNELINGSEISHNQLRITRMIESIGIHLSFLKYAKETFSEKNETKDLNQLKFIEETFHANLKEYIQEIFEYISELSKSKNNNSATFQAEALIDLLFDIDEAFKDKKDKLNEIEKNLLKIINYIRQNFKTNLFENLSNDFQKEINDKVEQFTSQKISVNSSNEIVFTDKKNI